MAEDGAYTDVMELTVLLQCLGFTLKSLEVTDGNRSQENGGRTVVIDCQMSGYHAVLESSAVMCSCPARNDNSGVWEVTGIAAGKHMAKESGSALLGSLPRAHRDRLSQELRQMIRTITELNESSVSHLEGTKSMLELASPDKSPLIHQLKVDSPLRYRSLDTLTHEELDLPPPGPLQKENSDLVGGKVRRMCSRQDTYTIRRPRSIPFMKVANKTSSPIQATSSPLLEHLLEADKAAQELRDKLSLVIEELSEGPRNEVNDSTSSLVLDVSKISLLKPLEPKSQFASSPNLSVLSMREDYKTGLKHTDSSASTSKINLGGSASKLEEGKKKMSKLHRLSPNFFKAKKDDKNKSASKDKSQESKSRFQSLFKPKVAVPVRRSLGDSKASTPSPTESHISINRGKFSHVKSTIPRPTPSKKE